MKRLSLFLTAAFIISIMASCASPYKSRKRCRGNGSWYGNRNLGAIEKMNKQDLKDYYVMKMEAFEQN